MTDPRSPGELASRFRVARAVAEHWHSAAIEWIAAGL